MFYKVSQKENLMKIAAIQTSPSFQRALTTKEKKEYKETCDKAREKLGTEETSAVIFDFNVPSEYGKNYCIGTLNSPNSRNFVDFLQLMSGMNKIQTGPQSELAYYSNGHTFTPVTSPYSGSTFTLGRHTISPEKLTTKEYGKLLSEDDIKSLDDKYYGDKLKRSYSADYTYILGLNKDGALLRALDLAYENFEKGIKEGDKDVLALNKEYQEFKENLSLESEKNILFDVISNSYHKMGKSGTDITKWDFVDRYLFTDKVDSTTREKRIKELEHEAEPLKFAQFLAHKQHLETKEDLNKKGIKLFGDCLVCFSDKEVWASPECFKEGWYTGGIDPNCSETNGIQPWNSPALNFDKLGKFDHNGKILELDETGKLLYKKFKNFMELYDGIRMDAFWQYVSPFIYNEKLEGKNIEEVGNKIIKIMEKAAIDVNGKFSPKDFTLELIGYNTSHGKRMTKNVFPHVYSTAYAEYNENPADLIHNQGYQDGYFTIGATSHDNDSLVNISRANDRVECHTPILKRNLKEGYSHLSYDTENYKKRSEKEKREQDFRTAKIAEIFTSKNQYYTLPDMFGMSERINISGKTDNSNWSVRLPEDYEKFYYSQLSNGYGINFPKAYEVALRAKGVQDKHLLDNLIKFSNILAEDGPMTTKEADKAEN